jgi:hypothetical protein
MVDFQPRYLLDAEIATFDLPSVKQLPNIMTIVDAASTLIDSECGRVDATGGGSLVYSTYAERIGISESRNIFRTAYAPLTGLDTTTQLALSGLNAVSGNHFYTGFLPNTTNQLNGNLSAFVGISGRYSYGRKSAAQVYPDSQFAANILQVAAFFGGPPQFVGLDVSLTDYYDLVGEVWVPAGLMMASYTEVLCIYNSGYDPRNMPKGVKHACAALAKNFIARAGGITSVQTYDAGKVHVTFTPDLVDPTVKKWLAPFQKVIAV